MAFEKGQSGNPGGRRKERPFRDALRAELAALGEDDPKALRGLARNLLKIASGEDGLQAIKEIADRLDGKPTQAVENGEDGPLEVLHRIERVIVDPANRDG
jgi:hypothetical protein